MTDEQPAPATDEDEDNREMIRSKWAMDGAATLSEAAQKLRAYADELVKLETDGWQLDEPITDDYGFASRT